MGGVSSLPNDTRGLGLGGGGGGAERGVGWSALFQRESRSGDMPLYRCGFNGYTQDEGGAFFAPSMIDKDRGTMRMSSVSAKPLGREDPYNRFYYVT